ATGSPVLRQRRHSAVRAAPVAGNQAPASSRVGCGARRASPPVDFLPREHAHEAPSCVVIIKNCAHDEKETDTFDDSFIRSPRWQGGSGWGWAGYAGRVRN